MIHRFRLGCLLALLVIFGPAAAEAQRFSGTGQRATPTFVLQEGLAVFEVEHRGEDRFVVRLLDEQGVLVDELASATGTFGGSKAVRIPRTGNYLLDVAAEGRWEIRLRPAGGAGGDLSTTPEFAEGMAAGTVAASDGWSWGWFGRGLLGGTVAGPVGAGFVASRAARSATDLPADDPLLDDRALGYREGYRAGFEARVQRRRQTSALVGGMAGTAVLAFIAIYVFDFDDVVTGGGGGNGGGGQFNLQPVR